MAGAGDIELRVGMNLTDVEAQLAHLKASAESYIAGLQRSGEGAGAANLGVAQQLGTSIGRVQANISASSLSPAEQLSFRALVERQSRAPFLQAAQGAPGGFGSKEGGRQELFNIQKASELSARQELGLSAATTAQIRNQAVEAGRLLEINQRIGRVFQTNAAINEEATKVLQNQSLKAKVDAEVRARILAGEAGNLSRTQRLQVQSGFLFGRTNLEGLPPSLGQIAGQSLATIGRFAGAGAAFYAVTRGITDTIKTAQQLEYDFSILNSQMTELGRGSELPQLKKDLFDIARETGLATDEVTKLGIAFVGALGSGGAGAAATKIASEIAVVAQLKPGEIFNDLVAGMKAFAETGSSGDMVKAEQAIGDLSIQLRNATGVAPKEIIDFLGRVGPIARVVGLDLKTTASVGAALLQGSAVSGATLGENFGRILTNYSKNASEIARLAQEFPKLGISIQDALSGDPNTLLKLVAGFKLLSQAQQQNLIQTVGSRREGQTLAVLFQNATTLAQSQTAAESAQGRVEEELRKRKQTLQLQVQQLTTAFQQFGLALYNLGVGAALKDLTSLASAIGELLNWLTGLSRILDHIPHQFGQLAGQVLLAVAAMRGLALFQAGKAGAAAAPSLLEGLGIGGLLRRIRGRGAGAAAEAAPATELDAAALTAPEAAGGLGAALGGPYTIGLVTAAIAIPAIMKGLRSNKGPMKDIQAQIEQLRATAAGVHQQVKGDLDQLIQEAGQGPAGSTPDLSNVPTSKLKDALSRSGKDDTKRIKDEIKRRKDARFFARVAFLRDQNLIDDEAEKQIAAAYAKGSSLTTGGTQNLEDFVSGKITSKNDISGLVAGKFDVAGIKRVGSKKISSEAQKRLAAGGQALASALDDQFGSYADALAAYDAGQITLRELNKEFRKEQKLFEGRKLTNADAKQYADEIKQTNKRNDDQLKSEYEIQSAISSLSGSDPVTSARTNIGLLKNQLKGTKDPDTRYQLAVQIATAEKELVKTMASQAGTAAEAAAILHKGAELEPGIRSAFIEEELRSADGAFQKFIARYLEAGLSIDDGMYTQISDFVAQGKTVVEALRLVLEAQIPALQAAAYFGHDISQQFQGVQSALAGIANLQGNLGVNVPPPKVTDSAEKDKQAVSDFLQAMKQYSDLQNQLAQTMLQNDPVALAQEMQREADKAARDAQNPIQKLQAQIERVKADRQLADAIQAVTQSQIDLVIAIANAAGNTLEAAYVAELKANQQLDFLRSKDPTTGKTRGSQEQINQAQGAATAAHAATRDAAYQDQIDRIDYQRQMDQITDAQEVNLLNTLLTMPWLDDKERDAIKLKIHEIQKSASADLQFNLPTELGLPTLYEARRLNQQGGQYNAGTYTDNRQVQVNVYAAAGVDTKAIAGEVVAQFSGASRTGYQAPIWQRL